MPKAAKNAKWLEGLRELRDEETPDSNRYMVYNKALNSLKKESRDYTDPDSLRAVKFIGPSIIDCLRNWMRDAGGGSTMEDISSNLPSPAKRKRSSGATSSGHKKRGRPPTQPLFEPTDDDDVMRPSKRHSGHAPGTNDLPQPLAFPPPNYPPGIAPQMYQHHLNPNLQMSMSHHPFSAQSVSHNQQNHGYLPAYAYQQPAGPGPVAPHSPPQPASGQSLPSFSFYYIDADRNRVRSHDQAKADIHDNALWYKLCFLDGDGSRAHPVSKQLRLVSYDTHKSKRREQLIEAWIKDQDVQQYGLYNAPGFTEDSVVANRGLEAASSRITSQTASQSREYKAGHLASNKSGEIINEAPKMSLEDLLKAESKKKRNTLDPSRAIDMDREWDVRRSGIASGPSKEVIETSVAAGKSIASFSQPRPSNSAQRTVLRKANTLPMTSVDPHVAQNIPLISPIEFGPASSVPSGSVAPPAPKTTLRRAATDFVDIRSAEATFKPKGKGKVRGRVSEFAPALPAVDDFDVDLDRQAAHQRVQAVQRESASTLTSASHASADLIDNVTDLTFEDAPLFPPFDHIVFPPHSYDITLVLDNREVKSHKHRDHIVSELRKKGVRVDQRSLSVGDVLWIAKRRWPGAATEVNECVLNYILERKRLDDLCGSIKDGRFHEQKFRLANTGLQVFYLIEDYDVEKNREVFGVQIDTARSSTQIVDGFIVKETKKLSYTIDYLTTMHQTILDIYQNKTLYVIPPFLIKRHSYMALQKHLRQSQPTMGHLTSYDCFGKLNSKSANLTTRDLLAQMLLSVKGLSAEKAAVIIEAYPTMRSLWDAFRVAEIVEREEKQSEMEAAIAAASQGKGKGRKGKSTVSEAKAMLCNLEASGRKRIGPVLSENIYRLLRANAYEE